MANATKTAEILSLRIVLASLREDGAAFKSVFDDFQTARDSDFEARGKSDLLWRVLRLTSAACAGAMIDADSRGIEGCETTLLAWIAEGLGFIEDDRG